MKEVLLISNLDLQSEDIMKYAAQFCEHYQCKLHILHFLEDFSPVLVSSSSYYDQFGYSFDSYEKKTELLTKIRQTTQEYIETDWLNVSIKQENETLLIQKFLSDQLIDLIIVGQHLFKKPNDDLGRKLKHVLSNITQSPMLVVPSLSLFRAFEKTNYLLQHMTDTNIKHINNFSRLFPDSEIQLTHVEQIDSDKIEKWTETKWLAYIHENINQNILFESLSMNYFDYIDRENYAITHTYDLLVFATANRNFWKRILTPSTTLKVLTNLEMPALVFKDKPVIEL